MGRKPKEKPIEGKKMTTKKLTANHDELMKELNRKADNTEAKEDFEKLLKLSSLKREL
ncbi:MAG TPA: hypothetical protein PLI68_11235 [Bacteroidia bacterium]|nr:hypothetical protein [Bacteroidia bacterium]HRH09195.1 hypothetical protein [Bacteroidia bacterium]HRH63890.1 hypothetical protein [Bacteroidia bacterium]